MTSVVPLINADGETRAAMMVATKLATSAQATANSADFDFSTLGGIDGLPFVQVVDTSGNLNHSGLDISVSGTTVTVAVTSLAATDTINVMAFGNKNA